MTVTSDIDNQAIAYALSAAFEGGSNYWYWIDKFIKPKEIKTHFDDSGKVFRHIDYPLSKGGALIISDRSGEADDPGKTYRLDVEAIQKGLDTLQKKYPKVFALLVAEDLDGPTADVFLQCCVFGDAVYG